MESSTSVLLRRFFPAKGFFPGVLSCLLQGFFPVLSSGSSMTSSKVLSLSRSSFLSSTTSFLRSLPVLPRVLSRSLLCFLPTAGHSHFAGLLLIQGVRLRREHPSAHLFLQSVSCSELREAFTVKAFRQSVHGHAAGELRGITLPPMW